jgi:hypothetical protein
MSQAIQALNAEKADVEMGLPLPEAWAKAKVEERRQQNIENQKRRVREELAQGR